MSQLFQLKNGCLISDRHEFLMDKDDIYFYDNHYSKYSFCFRVGHAFTHILEILLQRASHIEVFQLHRNPVTYMRNVDAMDTGDSAEGQHFEVQKVFEVWSSRPEQTDPNVLKKVMTVEKGFELYQTKRGRNTRILNNTAFGEREIEHVDYEDELDLLVLTMNRYVYLYDNRNGGFVKKIKLNWWSQERNEEWAHTAVLHRDKLIHLASMSGSSNTVCSIYTLKR